MEMNLTSQGACHAIGRPNGALRTMLDRRRRIHRVESCLRTAAVRIEFKAVRAPLKSLASLLLMMEQDVVRMAKTHKQGFKVLI